MKVGEKSSKKRVFVETDINDWRFRLNNCLLKFPARGDAFSILSVNDDHYNTKEGVFEWANVRRGIAGIGATSKAVRILERHLNSKRAQKNYLRKIQATAQ